MKGCIQASLGLTGVLIVVLGVIIIPVLMNMMLVFIVNEIMLVCPCSQLYPAWKEPSNSIPLYQSYYFLEIQNPDEVLRGARPRMREVGPYTYNMTMYRNDAVWNLNNTVTYIQPIWYQFVESMSAGSEEDKITTINFPFVAATSSSRFSPGFEQKMISALASTTNTTLFVEHSIKEILWGYYDPFLHAAQKILGKETIPDDHFGFLMGRNGTTNGLYTSFTGVGDHTKLAKIEYWNGTNHLNWWHSKWANMINGTDGTMFHPFVDKSETLYMFNPDTCRSMPYIYKEDASYLDIPLLHYYVPPYVFANTTDYPQNDEFCQPESGCRFSGVFNISTCSRGAPLGLSNPHFLYGSTELLESVDGLHPNISLHENFFHLEPTMGMPYILAERLQINLFVESVPHIRQTGTVTPFYYPFLWFEEKVTVKTEDAMKYKSSILKIKTVVFWLKIFLSVFGSALIMLALVLFSKQVFSRNEKEKKHSKIYMGPRHGRTGNINSSNSNSTRHMVDETSSLLPTA